LERKGKFLVYEYGRSRRGKKEEKKRDAFISVFFEGK